MIDASGTIVLPGFIDTHHHFYQALLRNVLANGLLADYFRDIANGPNSTAHYYRPQDAYIGGLTARCARSIPASPPSPISRRSQQPGAQR